MIFYPWYPADYLADTLHLSTLEDCFYRRMLDWCYMHERGLPIRRKQTYSLMRARTTAEKKAVDKILDLYFHKDPSNGGEMISFRVRKEIVRYLILREKRSCAGKQRHLQSAHAEHVLSNQNQIKNKKEESPNGTFSQDQMLGIPLSLFAEYKRLRESLNRPVLPGAETHIFAELLELQNAGEDPVEVLTRAVRTSSWKLSPKSKGGNSENEKQRRTKEAIEQAVQGSGRKLAH